MLITRIDITGLPHFNLNESSTQSMLWLIDPVGEKYIDNKLGISLLNQDEGFVAREVCKLLANLYDSHDDSNKCDLLISIFVNKIKKQSRNEILIFTIEIEFYNIQEHQFNDSSYDKEVDKGLLEIVFFNENTTFKLTYKHKLYEKIEKEKEKEKGNDEFIRIYRDVPMSVDKNSNKYALLQYIPLSIFYVSSSDFINKQLNTKGDNKFMEFMLENIDSIIELLTLHEDVCYAKNKNNIKGVTYKDVFISSFQLNKLTGSRVKSKVFLGAMVTKNNKNVFYSNVLLDFNKQFSLLFFIAATALYYGKNDFVILSHSMRNYESLTDLESIYSWLLQLDTNSAGILTAEHPTLSLIIS